MSLSYFLTSYPYSVLENDNNVMLLGVLERQGASTADELARVTGGRPEDVASQMVPLYLNRLVEVDGDVIKLTHHGKGLLDRFAVGDAVIAELLSDVESKEHREALRTLLSRFRGEDYVSYLASVRTQRVWHSWRTREASSTPVHLALLVRDVDAWAGASSSPSARDASAQLKVFANTVHEDTARGAYKPFDRAILLFARLRPESPAIHRRLPAPVSPDDQGLTWLRRLDNQQRKHSTQDWLYASCLARDEAEDDPLSVIERWLGSQGRHVQTLESQLEHAKLARDRVEFVRTQPRGDALGVLLAGRDRKEVADALGLTEEAVLVLLNAVRHKCELLTLSSEPPSPD